MVADEHGHAEHCSLETYFEIEELDEGWKSVDSLAIRSFRTDHVPEKDSWGFVVRDEASGERMIFGCDTRVPHPELLAEPLDEDFARGPIFHDCQLSTDGTAKIHVSLVEIDYSPAVQSRVVLVHYSDDVEDHVDRIRAAGLKIAHPGDAVTMPEWRSRFAS